MRWLVMVLVCCTMATPASAESIDSLAAIVNDQAITCYDVARDAKSAMDQIRQQSGGKVANLPSWQALNARVLDESILKALQLQEAKKLDLSVSADEVDAAIANIEKRNNLMPGQLKEALNQQGVDYARYRKNLHDQLLLSKLANTAVRAKLQVSDAALREFYRKYLANPKPVREAHLAQIFLALPEDPSPAQVDKVRAEADKIEAQLKAGANFSNMARLHSDAPESAQGGDMGWIYAGALNPRFDIVMQLPVGGISRPIRSPSGFHVLKILEDRWHQPQTQGKSYDEVHARHILLRIPSDADAATRAKIMHRAETISRDMQGASDEAFATRAKEASQDPGSAANGGDLGWFKRGMMIPAFEDAAFAMKPGQTSGVVKSQFGLHIIRVVGRRHVDPNSFEAHKDQIQEQLLNAEMQEEMPRWLAGLKADATIRTYTCQPPEYSQVEAATKPTLATAKAESPAKAALAAVEIWRQAWEAKNVSVVLASYADEFNPGRPFRSLAQWQDYRRKVILDKKFIHIKLDHLTTAVQNDGTVLVDFVQHYNSDSVSAKDHRRLWLKPVNSVWKIVREETLRP